MNGGVLPLTSNINVPFCGLICVLISELPAESFRYTVPLIGAPVAATPYTVAAERVADVPPPPPPPARERLMVVNSANIDPLNIFILISPFVMLNLPRYCGQSKKLLQQSKEDCHGIK